MPVSDYKTKIKHSRWQGTAAVIAVTSIFISTSVPAVADIVTCAGAGNAFTQTGFQHVEFEAIGEFVLIKAWRAEDPPVTSKPDFQVIVTPAIACSVEAE